MVDRLDTTREGAERASGAVMTASEVEAWFVREVLPLEAALMQYLQHNWRNKSDIDDLRQDVYVRVYEAARSKFPITPSRSFSQLPAICSSIACATSTSFPSRRSPIWKRLTSRSMRRGPTAA